MMNTTGTNAAASGGAAAPRFSAAGEKTTNPFRNENGKRARPAQVVYTSVSALMGARPSMREFSYSTAGTSIFGIVMRDPVPRGYKTQKGSAFSTVSVLVMLGVPDESTDVKFDVDAREIVFDIADPEEWEKALRVKKETGSSEFIKVSKRVHHRIGIDVAVYVSIPNREKLPGVCAGSVVRLDGLTCKSFRDKKNNNVFRFGLEAKDASLVPAVGSDPSRMVRFVRESGALSTWHYEEPFETEEEIERKKAFAGKRYTIVPLVRSDDEPGRVMAALPPCTPQRGFVALTRPTPDAPRYWFQVPGYIAKAAREANKRDSTVRVPSEREAGLANYEGFAAKGTWTTVITQWDSAVHPGMGMPPATAAEWDPERHPALGVPPDRALSYEIDTTVWSNLLHTTGISHPQLWAVFRFHVGMMDGVLAVQEDRIRTSRMQGNIDREMRKKNRARMDPNDPKAAGIGLKQLPQVWCRWMTLDVRGYLETAALRCSFPTATVLMGAQEGDAENPGRQLPLPRRVGTKQLDDENKTEVLLDFRPEGFVCLNATMAYKNMRTLNREVAQYYVVTAIAPRAIAKPGEVPYDSESGSMEMYNLRKCQEVVHLIQDAEVLEICKRATASDMEYGRLLSEYETVGADDPARESKQAAAAWLYHSALRDCCEARNEEDTPWLVFGTFDPPASQQRQGDRNEVEGELQRAIDGWRLGPTLIKEDEPKREPSADKKGEPPVKDETPPSPTTTTTTTATYDATTGASADQGVGEEQTDWSDAGDAGPPPKRPRTQEADKDAEGTTYQESWQEIPSPPMADAGANGPPPLEDAPKGIVPMSDAGQADEKDGEGGEEGEGEDDEGEEDEEMSDGV